MIQPPGTASSRLARKDLVPAVSARQDCTMPPAARVGDPTGHGPPLLGTGCPTVLIANQPAWRAIGNPAVMASVNAQKTTWDAAIKTAELATLAAAGTPGLPAAKAAEEATKAAAAAAMSAAMMSAMAAGGGPGGPPDLHTCPVPLPIPPHGPGMVPQGSATVKIGGLPAARQGDQLIEALGPPNSITVGCLTVIVGG